MRVEKTGFSFQHRSGSIIKHHLYSIKIFAMLYFQNLLVRVRFLLYMDRYVSVLDIRDTR